MEILIAFAAAHINPKSSGIVNRIQDTRTRHRLLCSTASKAGVTTPFFPDIVIFAGIDNVRFKRPVEPGDQLMLDVTLERAKAGIYKFSGQARVGEAIAVEADLLCTMRSVA